MSPSSAVRREIVEAPAPSPPRLQPARPWLPTAAALAPYLEEIDAARRYSNFGPQLAAFETRLAWRLGPGVRALSVANATLGLALGLQALGVQPGALCVMPSWSFVATPHAALQAGLTPWFLDVEPEHGALDPDDVRAALARAPGPVGAVVPVAPYGRLPDVNAWLQFQAETGLPVLLDAAAAFDALDGAALPAVVSLHATKVLGVGEGGYLATTDPTLAERFRELTSFGFRGTRESQRIATNAKLSEYAAAVGCAALDAWPSTRLLYLRAARLMKIAFSGAPEVRFQAGWGADWVSTTCVVRLSRPVARVEAAMLEAGVETRRWWGGGCHASPAFARLPRTPLPITAKLAETTLGLPFWADMTVDDIDRVAAALLDALRPG